MRRRAVLPCVSVAAALAAILVCAQAAAQSQPAPDAAVTGGMDGPARERPMDDIELIDFLDTAIHARVLDRACPELFDKDRKSLLYLGYRWGRSVGTSDAYPVQLFLTALQSQSEYVERLEGVDCAAPQTIELAESFHPYLDAMPARIRLSEMR